MKQTVDNNLILSVLIVVLCSILYGLIKYEIGLHFPISYYPTKFSMQINNANAILTSIFVFIFYLLIVSIAHLMAILFDGRLSLKKLFIHVGYGFIPLLILSAIIYNFSNEIFCKYALIFENTKDVSFIKTQIENDNTLQLLKFFNFSTQFFILVWTIYGLKKLYNLSILKAIMCITLPIIFTFVFIQLFNS